MNKTNFTPLSKNYFFVFFLFLFINTCINAQTYSLVWADEFNGTGAPDPAKWGYELGYLRNNELQSYTNSTNNVKQNAGNLEITAIKENVNGMQYTSGSITTLNKASWTYGKIEGRMRMPKGQGTWPAFWTLGVNEKTIGWPKCGEIDIVEHINNENFVHGTAHWSGTNDIVHASSGKESSTVDVTNWHIYSVVWDASAIKWYVDDVLYHEVDITAGTNFTDEFHLPQYIIVNLAIGGNWPGSPDGTTSLPATMYCDYIRVYKNTDTSPVSVAKITLSPSYATLNLNGTQKLETSFIPANTSNMNVVWTSSDPAVATVSTTGIVTGVSVGTAKITATTVEGGKTSESDIYVESSVGVNKMINGNFDDDTALNPNPTGWQEYGARNNYGNTDITPRSPRFNGIQTGFDYNGGVDQTVTDLPNGTYTAKAWVRNSGNLLYANFYIQNYGGNSIDYAINTSMPNWTEVTINNIVVTTNKCTIGFYQWTGAVNATLEYDDVELYLNAPALSVNTNIDSANNNLVIYPNPVKSGSILNIASNNDSDVEIAISNINGQMVLKESNKKGNEIKLQLPNLPKGVYFLKTISDSKVRVQKLVIE